jgi:hypothetical protein
MQKPDAVLAARKRTPPRLIRPDASGVNTTGLFAPPPRRFVRRPPRRLAPCWQPVPVPGYH